MIAPLAPHIAEELWLRLGHETSLTYADFPQADEDLAAEKAVTLPVQVNGKTRFTVEVPADATQREIERILADNADYIHHLEGQMVLRLVIVPGRIVNVVTQ
jgi:leucyl-tRNA synthetase